jgi:hypothetical protein
MACGPGGHYNLESLDLWGGAGHSRCAISKKEEELSCDIKDELVKHLMALNQKLNLLSPDFVQSEQERVAVEEQRGALYADIKRHRAKGHDGKPCPAARETRY